MANRTLRPGLKACRMGPNSRGPRFGISTARGGRLRRGLRLLLFVGCWVGTRTAASAPPAGAVDAAVTEATQALGKAPARSVVIASPLASEVPTRKGDDLALRIATLVASRMGDGARAPLRTAPLSAARALAGRTSAFVYVRSAIATGDLRVTLDLYPPAANSWDRIINPLGASTRHSFGSAKVDAEVRSFLAPLLLEQATVHRIRHDEGQILAAACGDADGDGGNELVLVSRVRVVKGRVRKETFVPERIALWSDLAMRSPVATREPLAGAVVSLGRVDVGTTDRGGVSLEPDFGAPRPLAGIPSWSGQSLVCLLPEPSAGAFDGAPVDCAPSRDSRPVMMVPSPRFDAFAAASVVDAGGRAGLLVAVREPSGKLRLKLGDATGLVDGTFGAQLAAGDLDQDGSAEIVTSGDASEDGIDIFSVTPILNEPRRRLHLATPEPVRALTICPPEDQGQPVLVAVVGDEIWLIRAATS